MKPRNQCMKREKSMYETSTEFLLFNAMLQSLTHSRSWVHVECLLRNPCCCLEINLRSSRYDIILFLITVSITLQHTEVRLIGL